MLQHKETYFTSIINFISNTINKTCKLEKQPSASVLKNKTFLKKMKNNWRKAIGRILAWVKLHPIKTDFSLGMFEGFGRILFQVNVPFLQKQPLDAVRLKKVFLKISQNSQKNTCTRVSFSITLEAFSTPWKHQKTIGFLFSGGIEGLQLY